MADIRITPATGVISITGSADFQGTGASSILFITGSGNVGIGTTNPTGKLTISQNNSGGVAALTFTEDESTIQGPSANTKILMGGNLSLNAASTWIAGTNGSERMRITSAGGVSFGSTGTAYGTSGQVLTSAGNASPTWTTPAGGSGGITTGKAIAMAIVFGG